MEYIKSRLGKYINLRDIKVLKNKNKKIISTCIYIPGELNYNNRTLYYFQGLVKSVETFNDVMNNKEWIYRIYYDKMFDKGITKYYNSKPKKINKSKKNMKKKLKNKTKKKLKRRKLKRGDNFNEYNYIFNNKKYKETSNNYKKTEIIQKMNKNKTNFKKLLKLYHLYITKIKNNKCSKYNNIELISYDCKLIKEFPDFIGHSSSFGMFLRFCPLLDKNVDLFYSVNSTHPITPQLKYIIDEWVNNHKLDALALCYKTKNILNSSKKYISEKIDNIKKKIIKNTELNNFDKEYIGIINRIYNLNIKENFDKDNFSKIENIKKLKYKDYEYTSLKKYNINYSLKNLLYYKNGVSTLNEVIGGGMFGIKNTFLNIKDRYNVFIDFIIMFIKYKIELDYGLDELLLKIILLPDVFVYSNKINNMKIIYLKDLEQSCFNNIHNLIDKKTSYLEDKDGKKILFDTKFYYDMKKNYPNFFTSSWLFQLDHYDSRKMYHKEDKITKLNDKEDIYININKNFLCWTSIFIGYNEGKKLLLLDENLHYSLTRTINIEDLSHIFNIIYIQDYKLIEMKGILKYIIRCYNKVIQPKIKIVSK